jgi:cupin fold WbuC family metalloprotein
VAKKHIFVVRSPKTKSVLALIVSKNFSGKKYNFLTSPEASLQLGINFYDPGETIRPHRHKRQKRVIYRTQEFIMVAAGSLTLLLYDEKDRLVGRCSLGPGDCVLLVNGGHGFKVRTKTKLVEIKQGPFLKARDKIFLALS